MKSATQLDFGGSKRVPLVQQTEASECGLAFLTMIAAYHGLKVDLSILRRYFGVSQRGTNLKAMMSIAERIGLDARAFRVEIDALVNIATPAILHWDLNHFVVLAKVTGSRKARLYSINDPAKGLLVLNESEISSRFTGVVLEVRKGASFKPQQLQTSLRISQLWSSISGLEGSLVGILVLSMMLQVLSLVAPFYLQLSVDNVIPGADKQLLKVLAIGFAGLAFVSLITAWLRSIALNSLTNAFSYQIVDNLCAHLLKLPLVWFERRHVGDIISRFGSIQPVSDFVSQGAISVVIDGIMAGGTLVLMFIYSPLLAWIAVSACIIFIIFKVASFSVLRRSNAGTIIANARESSAFIETVRGAATIKAFGQEDTRRGTWRRLKADAMNAQLKLGRLNAGYDAATNAVLAIERVIFIYVAMTLSIEGGFTLGMVFAFQAYKEQFIGAITRLTDQGVRLRILNVHLARIADIAISTPEPLGVRHVFEFAEASIIELKELSFRHSSTDPFVLRNVNMRVDPGQTVVLVGPSGGGKTTLIKLMMGLLEPTIGSISVDGLPLAHIGSRQWRARIGSVLQNDQLFAGSLAENIAFFDPDIDLDRVRDACRQAAVMDEIERMPLGLETLVGDMGSALSGGQRQRVLLARALYRQPAAIFMDEGTANLDQRNEMEIIRNLTQQRATKIIATHQPQTALIADRIFLVDKGSIKEIAMSDRGS